MWDCGNHLQRWYQDHETACDLECHIDHHIDPDHR